MQFTVGSHFFLFFKRYLKSWKNRQRLYFPFTNDHCQVIRLEWVIYISSLCSSIIAKLPAMSMHFFFPYSEKIKHFALAIIWKYFSKGGAKNDEMSWNNRLGTSTLHLAKWLWGQFVFPGLRHRDGEVSCWEWHQMTVWIYADPTGFPRHTWPENHRPCQILCL